MTDLVVASLEPWDAVWRRNQYLLAGLLRRDAGLRILFVEPDVDPVDALRRGHRPRRSRGLRLGPDLDGVDSGRLWLLELTKLLPRRVAPDHDRRWAHHVSRAADRLGLTDPVLWVNDPRGAEILSLTRWPTLYDITDDWTLADRRPVALARTRSHEDVLLERCDEVVVCSPALERSKGTRRHVTLVPNGVDSAAYGIVRPRPVDLPSGRIALYAGTLHRDRLDVPLCIQTARALPRGVSLVLLGPNALAEEDTAALVAAGVVVLGARASHAVPAYLQHADVLVVPHVVTPFTETLDPIKAYEYAAAGRPVVATPVAGFRDATSPRVLVSGAGGFSAAVERALAEPWVPQKGGEMRVSSLHDWSHRVDAMAEVVDRVAKVYRLRHA